MYKQLLAIAGTSLGISGALLVFTGLIWCEGAGYLLGEKTK